jgi:uncharacterized phage protein (TIGR01671 family)
MREIKFRVFNHGIKAMYNVYGFNQRTIQWCNDDGSLGGSFSYGKNNKKLFTLLQYTGLKDKNGKEIYEGDILGRIGFFHKVVINDGTNFYSYSVNNPQSIFILNKFSIDGYDEIIGNIYENPELLK